MNRGQSNFKNTIVRFLSTPEPGMVLDIPNVAKLQHLPGRQISFMSYKTGQEQIWQLPDELEPDPTNVFVSYLIGLYSNGEFIQ